MTMLGRKHSEETKKKISLANLGNKSFSGRKHTEEWKAKMRGPRPNRRGIPAWNKGLGKYKTRQEKERGAHLRKYGLNEEKYNELLNNQGYVCALCLNPEARKNKKGNGIIRLSIDHDHKTGKVRGLLCHSCNLAIGYLKDSYVLCENAAKYLLKHV